MNKVFRKFAELHSKISLHLIEVSPALSDIQEKTLTGGLLNNHQDDTTDEKFQSSEV